MTSHQRIAHVRKLTDHSLNFQHDKDRTDLFRFEIQQLATVVDAAGLSLTKQTQDSVPDRRILFRILLRSLPSWAARGSWLYGGDARL